MESLFIISTKRIDKKMDDKNIMFLKTLGEHKKLMGHMMSFHKLIERSTDVPKLKIFSDLKHTGLELALYYADFKCQHPKCNSTTNLTVHHLVRKNAINFMDKTRFYSLRFYWNNQIILCTNCHNLVDKTLGKNNKYRIERKAIEQNKIDCIKRKYLRCNNEK
jgi:hypothetical protein